MAKCCFGLREFAEVLLLIRRVSDRRPADLGGFKWSRLELWVNMELIRDPNNLDERLSEDMV